MLLINGALYRIFDSLDLRALEDARRCCSWDIISKRVGRVRTCWVESEEEKCGGEGDERVLEGEEEGE